MCIQNIKADALKLKAEIELIEDSGDFYVYKVVGIRNGDLYSPYWSTNWVPGEHRGSINYGAREKQRYVKRGIRNDCVILYGIHVFTSLEAATIYATHRGGHIGFYADSTVIKLKVRAKDLIGANFADNEACFSHVTLEQDEYDRVIESIK